MTCPKCGQYTRILETRANPDGMRRRYECANLHRFSTMEAVVQLLRGPKPPKVKK